MQLSDTSPSHGKARQQRPLGLRHKITQECRFVSTKKSSIWHPAGVIIRGLEPRYTAITQLLCSSIFPSLHNRTLSKVIGHGRVSQPVISISSYSINVVGSQPQTYATRPKVSMGRIRELLPNWKTFSVFLSSLKTWENEECCGNTSRTKITNKVTTTPFLRCYRVLV